MNLALPVVRFAVAAAAMITRPPALMVPCGKSNVPVTVSSELFCIVSRPSPRMVTSVRLRLSAMASVAALMSTVASCGAAPAAMFSVALCRLKLATAKFPPAGMLWLPPKNVSRPAPLSSPSRLDPPLSRNSPLSISTVPVVPKKTGPPTTVVVPAPRLMNVPALSIR